eukprot:3935651-Rhodomonas_salina.2
MKNKPRSALLSHTPARCALPPPSFRAAGEEGVLCPSDNTIARAVLDRCSASAVVGRRSRLDGGSQAPSLQVVSSA